LADAFGGPRAAGILRFARLSFVMATSPTCATVNGYVAAPSKEHHRNHTTYEAKLHISQFAGLAPSWRPLHREPDEQREDQLVDDTPGSVVTFARN
jgi:hypothetical protein